MCGIYCSIAIHGQSTAVPIESALKELLLRRGPNDSNVINIDGLTFGGFVLWQQGNKICPQPYESEHIVLLFNGDVFGGIDSQELKEHQFSDTAWLSYKLAQCQNVTDFCALLRQVEGPFAMIFYNKHTKDIYFARDSLGRNSLLIESRDGHLRLLSTSYFTATCAADCIMELPPCGLYKLNALTPSKISLYPWSQNSAEYYAPELAIIESTFNNCIEISDCINPAWLTVENCIDNPMFDFYELCKSLPKEMPLPDLMNYLMSNSAVLNMLTEFGTLLECSVQNRIEKTTKYCGKCLGGQQPEQICSHSKIAVLFSGGIDCTILACIADKFVPLDDAIDLINVAFEPVTLTTTSNNNDLRWLVPDRKTAKESLLELQSLSPKRKWQLIEVNVTRKELHESLVNHIQHLIYPLCSILDESIGAAFWHAAMSKDASAGGTMTSARVVIVGSGADELFGGYQRHRRAFQRCSGNLLEKQLCVKTELEKDWLRIPSRNLARDDRVVADSSRTLRAPFIEENLVNFINGKLHPNQRCCFLLDEGVGDKLFLRLYGYQLGLRSAVSFKKRAIQFGSKIANKKQNASDQSSYLNFTNLTVS